MTTNHARLLGSLALAIAVASAVGWGAGVAAAVVVPPVITGHVVDTAGQPLPNTDVHLWRNTLPDHPWFDAADGSTDANGDYTLTYPSNGYWPNGVGYGGDYAVLFEAPGTPQNGSYYRPQWWNGVPGYFAHPDIWQWEWQAANLATKFTLTDGETKPGVDAVIEPYQGTIDCTVSDAHTGQRIHNVRVTLYHFDKVTVGTDPYDEGAVYTNSNGRFTSPAEPTLSDGSWWTLLFEKAGYRKVWLASVAYKSGVEESEQASQTVITHFQVASNATSPIKETLAPLKVTPTITRTPSASTLTCKRKHGEAKFTLAAKLSDVRGVVAGASVRLQRSTNGSSWTTLTTPKTTSAGKVSKTLYVSKIGKTYYRWYTIATAYDYSVKTSKQKVVVK